MLPTEIEYILENYDAEDFNLSITKADYSGNIPMLSLTVNKPDAEPQYWRLEVIGHRESNILFTSINYNSTILITNDHPLLWQYADFHTSLYFKGTSKDIYKVISELNQIDFNLFDRYLHSSAQLYTLLKTSNGLLSSGPKKLLTQYEQCLNKHGIETSMIGGYIPTYWDGNNHVSGETLQIFLIAGSYLVAQDFIFTRQA